MLKGYDVSTYIFTTVET